MKKFCRLKLFGLVVISTMVLIFMAINFLEATKPQRWEWEVYIPGKGEDVNLYADTYDTSGNPIGNLFTDTDPIFVRVKRNRNVLYSFRLWIGKDRNNLEKIGFQNLGLTSRTDVEPSGNGPCSFPPNELCQGSYNDAPGCMESFLVTYPHPYTDPDPDKYYDYETFWLSIDVDCDIEGMNSGTIFPSGNVHIEIHKTDSVLPTGCEDLHSIVVDRDVVEGSGIIKITKLDIDKDSWRIEVDTTEDFDNDTIRFTEAYWDYRGKGKGKFVTKKPIRAKAPFRFTTTWTRY